MIISLSDITEKPKQVNYCILNDKVRIDISDISDDSYGCYIFVDLIELLDLNKLLLTRVEQLKTLIEK